MYLDLPNEEKTRQLGDALAKSCPGSPFLMTLRGNLGVGKSHLARAFLKKLGVTDTIPSPSYTLCETYHISENFFINHLDLYRLEDPEELEFFGFREMIAGHGLLIEWAERAGSLMPTPDLDVHLVWYESGRQCALTAQTLKGDTWLLELAWPGT